MESITARSLSRRTMLKVALGIGGTTLLAACSQTSTTPTATTGAAANTAAPTAAPAASPTAAAAAASPTTAAAAAAPTTAAAVTTAAAATPSSATGGGTATPAATGSKIPSPALGVPDAYLAMPTPYKSYSGTPGTSGKVSAFTIAYQPPPTPRGQNQYWQELEKRLGVTWDPIITPQPDYGEKSAALIAGGSIPDLFYLNPGQNAAPQYLAIQQGAFVDLTPYLTGDALKEYKNLATFPAYVWDNVKFRGKIYGVPKPIQRNGNLPIYRSDWAKKLGKETFSSPKDVHDLLVAFAKNDPDGNGQADTWGMGRYGTTWTGWDNTLAFNMFGTPFNWRKNSDGTMTFQIETPEFQQALDFLRQLYADGAYYPDAGSMTFAQAQNAFISGKTGLHSEGIGNFYSPQVPGTVYYKVAQVNPKAELTGLLPSLPGGSKAVTYNTPGSFGYTGIPSTLAKNDARIKELLRILDYLAAPFGSEEYVFLHYGIKDVDYTVDAKGAPLLSKKGQAEIGDLVYLMSGLPVIYIPQAPEVAVTAQKMDESVIKLGIDDPSWPLYSPTNVSKAAQLNQFGYDTATAIITGRQPMSYLTTAIKDWKSRGGDQITQEFQQSLKQS